MEPHSSAQPSSLTECESSDLRPKAVRCIAILGPPGSGKSTLAVELALHLKCPVFRLREWAETRSLVDPMTSRRRDWFTEAQVEVALRTFLRRTWATPVGMFIADNFPGTADQMDLLDDAAANANPSSNIYVFLDAPSDLLIERISARRVCQSCEGDRIGDPRLPAVANANDAALCNVCGGVLRRRQTDSPNEMTRRCARYRRNEVGIRRAVAARSLPMLDIDVASAHNIVELVVMQVRRGWA